MGVDLDVEAPVAAPPEPEETSGLTTRLVLLYAERRGGPTAMEALIERAGLGDRRRELLDETAWFSYENKIALFEAAAEVFDDPDVMFDVGSAALDLNVGRPLRMALKALGSPRLVYRNVVRANGKFSRSHAMQLLDDASDRVRVRFADLHGARSHPLDCQYSRGLLTCVPVLFGQPAARVSHRVCAAGGGDAADGCVYDVRWDERGNLMRRGLVWGATTAAATAAAAAVAPDLLPAAGIVALVGAAPVARQILVAGRRRHEQLEAELADLGQMTHRLTASLRDVVSELRLEDVLAKVTANAGAAVGGGEFALLLNDPNAPGTVSAQSCAGLDSAALHCLERWCEAAPRVLEEPRMVDDVTTVAELAPLAGTGTDGLRSLCSAPLVVRGERLGVLVALAGQRRGFLPRDVELLEGYAAQAAIAVANARLYEAQALLATHDPLTGLLNHRAFHESFAREVAGGRPAVVLLDLDDFKRVNDTDGHAAGDRLLAAVARALRESCRPQDRAFRLGGDEFALLLQGAGADAAETVARRAAAAIAAVDHRTGVSHGIALFPADGRTKEALLATADARLYEDKRTRLDPVTATAAGDAAVRLCAEVLADVLGEERAQAELRARASDAEDPAILADILGALDDHSAHPR